ncbi:MAG: YcxB family protein [Planctomycetes bacterium]|nr:YcxB family protein [Planctomycetota bacterium]
MRTAIFAFWRRAVGTGYFVACALIGCALAYLLWSGDQSWISGALGAFLLFALGAAFLVYFIHLRGSLARFKAMGAPIATVVLEDASITMSSGLTTTSLPWSRVTEVWRFESFWLMFFSKAQFVILPIGTVPADAQEFIISKVSATGGKVAAR